MADTFAETCYEQARAAGFRHSVAVMMVLHPKAGTQAGWDQVLTEAREVVALVAHVYARWPQVFVGDARRMADAYLYRRAPLQEVRATLIDELAAHDEATHTDTTRRAALRDMPPQSAMQHDSAEFWKRRRDQT